MSIILDSLDGHTFGNVEIDICFYEKGASDINAGLECDPSTTGGSGGINGLLNGFCIERFAITYCAKVCCIECSVGNNTEIS